MKFTKLLHNVDAAHIRTLPEFGVSLSSQKNDVRAVYRYRGDRGNNWIYLPWYCLSRPNLASTDPYNAVYMGEELLCN